MTEVCRELRQRLAAGEWHRDRERFLQWLDGVDGIEACVAQGLEETRSEQNWYLFEGFVNVAYRRPDIRQAPALCSALALRSGEVNNEDIVDALGEVRDPASIDCLAAVIRWEPDWDEFRGLAVKCVWALAAIGTPEAWAVLDEAAATGPEVVREAVYAERS